MIIDIENFLITTIRTAVKQQYSKAVILAEYPDDNASFPCVVIKEIENSVDMDSIDSTTLEMYSNLAYDINIFSNLKTGRKEQARNIALIVNDTLSAMGFQRTMGQEIPNYDTSIYRYYLRFEGRVDVGVIDNDTKKYTIYKK